MKTRIDERFRREAKDFRFQFSCEHCAHFDELRRICVEGYPNDEHESASLERDEILFCKLFEGA
jgi:hypothetical protein